MAFRLLKEDFAFPIQDVREVVQMTAVTPVPQAPSAIVGMVDARGEIVPVVNLRALLGLSSAPPEVNARLIVVEFVSPEGPGKRVLGCLADGMTRILRIPRHLISPAPPELRRSCRVDLDGIARIEGRLIMILRAATLLSPSELTQLPA